MDAEHLRLLDEIHTSAGRAADLSSQLLAFAGKGRLTTDGGRPVVHDAGNRRSC